MIAEPFGVLSSREPITRYRLENSQGMSASIISLGAIVTGLEVPDRYGVFADVVTGFSNLASYEAGHPFFGAIIGRIAGRLSGGKFTLDNQLYSLELNDPPNHLHGGNRGFDKRIWSLVHQEENLLTLSYRSPDGESGYPGCLDTIVSYRITEKNEFVIDYRAYTDRATPLSLTNHTWFNLAGEGNGTILDHTLEIEASYYTPTDDMMTLLGVVQPVDGKVVDLRKPRRLEEVLPYMLNKHGDNYIFPDSDKSICRKVARLSHEDSGRVMEVFTTERCIQFYGGKALDGSLIGKSGNSYISHGALCLECQGYPDGPNHPEIDDIILMPKDEYRQTTKYLFHAN